FGSDTEVEVVAAEECIEHGCSGCANCCMRTRIGGIGRRVANLWKPVWIGCSIRVVVLIGSADGRYRTPEVIRILGVVEGDDGIREAEIQQRKQPGALRSGQTIRQSRLLGDFVPIVLNGSVPEAPGQSLIVCGSGAACDPEGFHFIEGGDIRAAGLIRGRAGTKLAGELQRERRDLRPLCERRAGQIRRRLLVVSRSTSEYKGSWDGIGSIVAA